MSDPGRRTAIKLMAIGLAFGAGLLIISETLGQEDKKKNPLAERAKTDRRADAAAAKSSPIPSGAAVHMVTVEPATSFDFRYESAAGVPRVIRLERAALESKGASPSEVLAFRAGVSPREKPTTGGFYTSPDSIPMSAEATTIIEGGVSGDSIICRSYGSFAGLKVVLTIYRENPDGSIERILREEIKDANEHKFKIP